MDIAFFERGEGPTSCVVMHGFLGSGRNLGSFCTRLSEARPDLHLYVCDLPGHGTSAKMARPEGLRSVVAPMAAFVRTLAETSGAPVACIGHSMGGRVAMCIGAEEREIVSKVIAIDIAPGPIGQRNADLENVARALLAAPKSAASRDEMRAILLADGLSPSLADWLLMNLRNEEGSLAWRIDREAIVRFGAATRGDDLWPMAEALGARLACIYGERSGFVLPEDVARLAELGARVVPIADAGHFVHIDALDALVDAVSRQLPAPVGR